MIMMILSRAGSGRSCMRRRASLGSAENMLVDGIVASSMTPFSPSGELRLDLIPAHIEWLIAEGVHGLSPLGSSGEFVGLEVDDRKRVLEAGLDAKAGRRHVMAGTHL